MQFHNQKSEILGWWTCVCVCVHVYVYMHVFVCMVCVNLSILWVWHFIHYFIYWGNQSLCEILGRGGGGGGHMYGNVSVTLFKGVDGCKICVWVLNWAWLYLTELKCIIISFM